MLILISCSLSEIFEFAAIHSPESSNGFPYAYDVKYLKISIHFVASVLYCSIYHCTSFEKNESEKFGILIFDDLFIRYLRIIPEGENMPI